MATFTQMRDEMKTCPYNPLHKVSTRRLQQHIVKCSKNPANPVLMDCPFNALHRIHPQEMQRHLLLCKDGRPVIRELDERQNGGPIMNRPQIIRSDAPVSSEDWESEISNNKIKSYVIPGLAEDETPEPEEERDEKPISFKSNIQIQCMKPAERKKYYREMVEFTKLQQKAEQESQELRAQRPEPSSASPTPSTSTPIVDVKAEREDSVRKPRTNPFRPKAVGGIGRGFTPPITRVPNPRPVGVSTESRDLFNRKSSDSNIKRELSEDDNRQRVKRFSPDLN